MAEGFNKAIVEGNIARIGSCTAGFAAQIEIKTHRWDSQTKTSKESKEYVWCVVAGKNGEFFAKDATVGAFVRIDGQLRQHEVTIDAKPYRLTCVEASFGGAHVMLKNRSTEQGGRF
jgi:single-stranded DNA-binding protein